MFIHDDFLLQNELAKKLYHDFAKDLPIIDYHCHLDPKTIFENKPFKNLTEVWLSGDHYKWRLMRAYGIDESYITGNQPDELKFNAWSKVVPNLFGNPVFHWSQLELKRYFNIDDLLTSDTSKDIYEKVNASLKTLKPIDIINQSQVEVICTTDDPADSLIWHQNIKQENHNFKVLPTYRPDKAINIESAGFIDWLSTLGVATKLEITDLNQLKHALSVTVNHFSSLGTKLSDHALDLVQYEDATESEVSDILNKRFANKSLTLEEISKYKGYILVYLGGLYQEKNWVQQYHIGAFRNTNLKQFETLGPDTGFDAIYDQPIIAPLTKLLNALVKNNALPKTILYTLNPSHFDVIVPLMQAFQDGITQGKIQFGSAWWHLDNIDGMRKQMKALQSYGLFSSFVGMLTDSRSFLSYTRHEYFRRLLCQIISEEVLMGHYPNDINLLKKLVQDISYNNAKQYFNF